MVQASFFSVLLFVEIGPVFYGVDGEFSLRNGVDIGSNKISPCGVFGCNYRYISKGMTEIGGYVVNYSLDNSSVPHKHHFGPFGTSRSLYCRLHYISHTQTLQDYLPLFLRLIINVKALLEVHMEKRFYRCGIWSEPTLVYPTSLRQP